MVLHTSGVQVHGQDRLLDRIIAWKAETRQLKGSSPGGMEQRAGVTFSCLIAEALGVHRFSPWWSFPRSSSLGFRTSGQPGLGIGTSSNRSKDQ